MKRLALLASLFAAGAMLSLPEAAAAQSRNGTVRVPAPMPPPESRPNPLQTRPLPEIVARVQATPPYDEMDYIGVAGFEVREMVYLLRFIDGRQVVVVHVDARSGRIIGRSP